MIQLGYMIWMDKEREYNEWLEEREKEREKERKKKDEESNQ